MCFIHNFQLMTQCMKVLAFEQNIVIFDSMKTSLAYGSCRLKVLVVLGVLHCSSPLWALQLKTFECLSTIQSLFIYKLSWGKLSS
jgi:hypothetical protein